MPHLKDQSKSVSHFCIDIFASHQCPREKALLAHKVNNFEERIQSEGMIMPRSLPRDPICWVRVEGYLLIVIFHKMRERRKLTRVVSRQCPLKRNYHEHI